MKEQLLEILRCKVCSLGSLSLDNISGNEEEIRSGYVLCDNCGNTYEIRNGIVDTIENELGYSKNELTHTSKWGVYGSNKKEIDSWLLTLPKVPPHEKNNPTSVAIWGEVENNFNKFLDYFKPICRGNETILEIGAARGWSLNILSQMGCYCVGVDMLESYGHGLHSSDAYIYNNNVYFERVLSGANLLPFLDNTFDYVIMTATFHHLTPTDESKYEEDCIFNAIDALREIKRVLKQSGNVCVISEPIVDSQTIKNHNRECHKGGQVENEYTLNEYLTIFEIMDIPLSFFHDRPKNYFNTDKSNVNFALPDSGFKNQFSDVQVPQKVCTDQLFKVRLTITNSSNAIWPSYNPYTGIGVVNVSYHWYTVDDKIIVTDGMRTSFNNDINPGQTVTMEASIKAPPQKGLYKLQLQLVQEGIAWFHDDMGAEYSVTLVQVIPLKFGQFIRKNTKKLFGIVRFIRYLVSESPLRIKIAWQKFNKEKLIS